MKTSQKEIVASHRARHHAALAKLSTDPKADGLKLWRKLAKLEREVHESTTAQCNGEAYGSQPFRPDWLADGNEGTEENPTEWEVYSDSVRARVKSIFGAIPDGFFINHDARGYALKLNPEKCTLPEGLETDWGGYGLLAPQID